MPTSKQQTAITETVPGEVVEATSRIKLRIQRTAQDVLEIGLDLTLIKGKVGHGNFLSLIEREFGMSDNTAQRFMRVATLFKYSTVEHLPPAVLYAIADTPAEDREEVRANVVELASKGEKVSKRTVDDLKAQLKDAKNALREAKSLRDSLEDHAREVILGRNETEREVLFLRSQVDQLHTMLAEARGTPREAPAPRPLPEPEVLPPPEDDLRVLRAVWRHSSPTVRQTFLDEVTLGTF